jgi:hypothetical protein
VVWFFFSLKGIMWAHSRRIIMRRVLMISCLASLILVGCSSDKKSDKDPVMPQLGEIQFPTLTETTLPPTATIPAATETAVAIATLSVLPTPEANPQLDGLPPHAHPDGYFQTFMPQGEEWAVQDYDQAGELVQTVINSPYRLVVIHTMARLDAQVYATPDDLSAQYLTMEYFASAWFPYTSWAETRRAVEGERVIIDFSLVADFKAFLGREITRQEDGIIYTARIVVPANDPALLDLLQTLVTRDFVALPPAATGEGS